MPWAFPPASCSLAKRLPLFTFRSIRAVNSSENTVIVAVVKRYVQPSFLSALFLSFSSWLGVLSELKCLTQRASAGLQPVMWSKLLMFSKQICHGGVWVTTCVLSLRPDREEASVMPLINAGFNRVSDGVCVCVSVLCCLCLYYSFDMFYIPAVNTRCRAGTQIVNRSVFAQETFASSSLNLSLCSSRQKQHYHISYNRYIDIIVWYETFFWCVLIDPCCPLTLRDMWRMPIWWPAIMSCYSWSMERCGRSSNSGESGVIQCCRQTTVLMLCQKRLCPVSKGCQESSLKLAC